MKDRPTRRSKLAPFESSKMSSPSAATLVEKRVKFKLASVLLKVE